MKKIIQDFDDFITGNLSNWYVGIAKDPLARLKAHGVKTEDPVNTSFICRGAANDTDSRAIEKHFLDKGADGGGGGGDNESTYVYAYQKKSFTKEDA